MKQLSVIEAHGILLLRADKGMYLILCEGTDVMALYFNEYKDYNIYILY